MNTGFVGYSRRRRQASAPWWFCVVTTGTKPLEFQVTSPGGCGSDNRQIPYITGSSMYLSKDGGGARGTRSTDLRQVDPRLALVDMMDPQDDDTPKHHPMTDEEVG